MEIQRHPSSILNLAKEIIKVVDAYWTRRITEKELNEYMTYWAHHEAEKLFRANEWNPTIKQRVGSKRLKVMEKMLSGYQIKM
ncbi:TIGR04540 family protein [Geosporobacter ferrireducens]|uniref:Uncharacterized protein n=1 Tax=Geosporobacter ferrireducens TaxID=1424294 RepID=A0A1D8GBQ8_9FIRM|nr:TIGR04540 family protein [Geosporobacter ferrireducens]AOT68339.1 hypothetical protein Gferi_01265 [Geosporobacter ferrireducens]MTI53779.1 TIGR04540 family protein [Geosporobacter ferrireducens]